MQDYANTLYRIFTIHKKKREQDRCLRQEYRVFLVSMIGTKVTEAFPLQAASEESIGAPESCSEQVKYSVDRQVRSALNRVGAPADWLRPDEPNQPGQGSGWFISSWTAKSVGKHALLYVFDILRTLWD